MRSALGILLLASSVSTAVAAEPASLRWSWGPGVHHRFYIENEVHLPAPVMLYGEFNAQARLVAFQGQIILDCTEVEERRNEWELRCTVEDVSLVGATMQGDRGKLAPVLEEIDARLMTSTLQIMLRHDGRIRHVDLQDIERSTRQLSQNAETVRLLLVRGLAGLDLQLPDTAEDQGHGWTQFQSLLMATPYERGSQGSTQLVNRVKSETGPMVIIETAGRGASAQATDHSTGPANIYMIELTSTTRFDRETGVVSQRRWTVIGEPTAGSAVNDGFNGVTYLQAGQLTYLAPDVQAPELWPTRESDIPGARGTSAIQGWSPIPSLSQ